MGAEPSRVRSVQKSFRLSPEEDADLQLVIQAWVEKARAQGFPEGKQGNERKAREQRVGAAFRGLRHDTSPPAFERRTRHHTVLYGEQEQQQRRDR